MFWQYIKSDGYIKIELRENRKWRPVFALRLGGKAMGNFFLKHQASPRDVGAILYDPLNHRRGNVERQIADKRKSTEVECFGINGQNIALKNLDIGFFPKSPFELSD